MSKPTSIKTSEEVRNRLRILADERGTTITELLEGRCHVVWWVGA
jgi:predicted DNA-binding protein